MGIYLVHRVIDFGFQLNWYIHLDLVNWDTQMILFYVAIWEYMVLLSLCINCSIPVFSMGAGADLDVAGFILNDQHQFYHLA